MDSLKQELLNKGMDKYASDVESMSKSLEMSKKKSEEIERIKREQDLIKREKELIEQEKEKLRQEAENLRLERELILMTSTPVASTAVTAAPPVQPTTTVAPAITSSSLSSSQNIQSSSTSSTTSSTTLDQLDPGYGTMNDQQDFHDSYAINQNRKYHINVVNKYQSQQQQQPANTWLQNEEEAEHQRLSQNFLQNQSQKYVT
jgi:hypothetical protein